MWAVWVNGHIHQDMHGQLAVFATRKAARRWVKVYGMGGLLVARIAVLDSVRLQ